MDIFARTLRSESFIEKAFLLLLTALLSGFLIPLVVKSIDVAREGKDAVTRAQSRLFEELSETILTYETLALDVSWYGTPVVNDKELQKKAVERYSDRMVDLVSKWRAQLSRAQTLASPEVSGRLDAFLGKVFEQQDTQLVKMWASCSTSCDWESRHKASEEMLSEANALIALVARDFGLIKKDR